MPRDAEAAIESANAEALKELHQGAREQEEEEPKGEIVEPQDPEEEKEPEELRGEAKRRNRYREQAEARQAAERENQDLKVRLAAMEAARVYAQPAQQQSGPQKDPYDERIEAIQKEQEEVVKTHRTISGDTPEAEAARELQRQKYMRLNADIQKTYAEQAVMKNGGGRQPSVKFQLLRERYGDVVDHPNEHVPRYADGLYRQQVAMNGGREPTPEQYDRLMETTRRQFGMAKSPTPSSNVKAKFQGSSVGARGSNGAPESNVKSFSMGDKHYMRMARAAFPGKTDKVAFQMWVNDQNKD